MDKVERAMELFKSGYHCSQAVLGAFSKDIGLSEDIAFKIACPFGGGLGGYGRTCGALTGGMMVLGLKYGASLPTDSETKKISREKTRELIEIFERIHGTSICNELVGFDRSKLSGAELAERRMQFYSICPKFIESVVAYIDEEL